MILKAIVVFLTALFIGLVLSPLILKLTRKIKMGQTILEYVEEHKAKQGTPTMGGIIFIFASILACLIIYTKDSSLGLISLATMFCYGLLGFLDDFIKIKYKQNKGLSAYQKIIGQLGIATIFAIYCYKSSLVGSEIYVPFVNTYIDLGWVIIPFIIFTFLAMVNSVNLIDGLDGLCGGVSFVNLLAFGVVILLSVLGFSGTQSIELTNLSYTSFALAGGILAFLTLNVYPAKIFMGDTGSLAIGGLLTAVAVLSKMELFLLIFGVLYVITAISDVLQVLYYKKTKKRIFLMAPLHHHFQKKGVHENKIVFVYILITTIVSLLTIVLTEM